MIHKKKGPTDGPGAEDGDGQVATLCLSGASFLRETPEN